MARRKRFEARRAKREAAAEQEIIALARKQRKDDLATAREYFRQRKIDEWSRLFGLHRRAEVRILEGKMRAVRATRITFWSKEAILNDPHKRSLIARQKARRKR